MRYRWLSFALFFISLSAYTQSSDTAFFKYREALRKKDNFKAGIHLADIAKYFYDNGSYDSAFIYYKTSLELNRKAKNDTMIASNLNDLGALYGKFGVPDSALIYYKKAFVIYEKIGNNKGNAYAKINIAIILKEKGAYERALENALNAEAILRKYPDDEFLDNCYHTIATIYSRIENFSASLSYHRKAMALRRARGERSELAGTLNNMGNLYKDIVKYDSAIYYYNQSLEIKRTLSNKKSAASTLTNLGEVLTRQGRINEAEDRLLESLKIKQELDDKPGLATTLNDLAACNISKKNYPLAEQYLDQAQAIEQAAGGLLSEQKSNLELRVALYRAKKEFKKASDYAENLATVKDSLLGAEKVEKLAEIQTRYETESKEQQIELLNIDNMLQDSTIENQRLSIALLFAFTIFILISLLFYFISYIGAKRHRERIEMLMKELHHRVKNNLQILSSVLSLQSQSLTDENALLSVKSTESRINAMALIHRKLYSDDKNTIVSTRGYFRELIEFLLSSFGYSAQNVKLNIDIDEIELDVDKAIPLGLIMNELISNAFKHAYATRDDRQLDVIVKQRGSELHAVVRDNGNGISGPGNEESKFGMSMVSILVRDLKGKFETVTNAGTEHKLIIPLV